MLAMVHQTQVMGLLMQDMELLMLVMELLLEDQDMMLLPVEMNMELPLLVTALLILVTLLHNQDTQEADALYVNINI